MPERPENARFITMNGRVMDFDSVRIHPLNTAMKYAASVFDAWRGYWNAEHQDLYVFRLREHLERLVESAAIAQIECPYTVPEMFEQTMALLRANEYKENVHCRAILFVDELDGGLFSTSPVSLLIAALPMNRYFKVGAEGVHCCVSSWRRISDDVLPPRVKAAANYPNSRLAGFEALANGYDAAILLNREGKVTEGPAYTLFIVRHGRVITPPVTSGVLESVTRDTFLRLCREITGHAVIEREVDRTELYVAEEAFFCGSSAEATPILSVDRRAVGGGTMGPITQKLRNAYLEIVHGRAGAHEEWLSPVYRAR